MGPRYPTPLHWGPQDGVFFALSNALNDVIKPLKQFDVQQREKLENILGAVLPDESWTQATLPITFSGMGVFDVEDTIKDHTLVLFSPLKVLLQK